MSRDGRFERRSLKLRGEARRALERLERCVDPL